MFLTEVTLDYKENLNYRLLFGNPVEALDFDHSHGPQARKVFMRPGSLFGLYLWEANHYGTTRMDVYILRALWPGEAGGAVQCVKPGAEILLHARGKRNVKDIVRWLELLKEHEGLLEEIPAERYLVAGQRFRTRFRPRLIVHNTYKGRFNE